MTTFLRACLALASFALIPALFASEIDIYVASGQQLEFQFTGNTSGEIAVSKLSPGGDVVAFVIATPAGNGWSASDNFWDGDVYLSGITFSAGSPAYRAILSGLPAGTYRIGAYGTNGNLVEYYRHQSGSTASIYQSDNYTGLYADFSFEVY